MPRIASPSISAALLCALACTGNITGGPRVPEGVTLSPDAKVPTSGARRLSRDEYDRTLEDLIGDQTHSGFAQLPEDTHDPFDNNYSTQVAGPALIQAVENLASDAAARLVSDPVRLARVLPCTATSAGDRACFEQFITRFGRRALRRPLSAEEVQRYLTLVDFAVEKNDFNVGVQLAVEALLQDPELMYRVELGTAVPGRPGTFRLTPHELATRLSYFLWGSTPPDWLLDLADAGQLTTTEHIRTAAEKLLADPHARARVDRFHALWLGFHQLPHRVELTQALRLETGALIQKVVFDDASDYFELFNSKQTYVNPLLAAQYGLPSPPPNTFAWTPYTGTERQGILSQGAVLSAGAKFNDTSPTQRGIFIRTRLLCADVPPPPPDVNVDQPPESATGSCKADRYAEHAQNGNCASCHRNLDPVGFGLERYDTQGRYRTHDDGKPECGIAGQGKVTELGDFAGPKGLADLVVGSGKLESCVVTQVYRFAMGRRETPSDLPLLGELTRDFQNDQRHFDRLLMRVVTHETFAFRQEE